MLILFSKIYKHLRRKIAHVINKKYVFRFEDLVQNPNVYLKEIFSFIGLSMPSYIETIQNSTNEKYFELWETAQQDSSHELHVEINPELEKKLTHLDIASHTIENYPMSHGMTKQRQFITNI